MLCFACFQSKYCENITRDKMKLRCNFILRLLLVIDTMKLPNIPTFCSVYYKPTLDDNPRGAMKLWVKQKFIFPFLVWRNFEKCDWWPPFAFDGLLRPTELDVAAVVLFRSRSRASRKGDDKTDFTMPSVMVLACKYVTIDSPWALGLHKRAITVWSSK